MKLGSSVVLTASIGGILMAGALITASGQSANVMPERSAVQPISIAATSVIEVDDRANTTATGTTSKDDDIPANEARQPAKPAPATPDKGYVFAGSLRLRVEDQNYFPTSKANGAYTFLGGALRYGVTRQTKLADYMVELEAPFLFGLPTKAIASAPQGQLGHGATYFAANGSQVASVFLKQAWVRIKDFSTPGQSLRLGRFEFSDGLETTATDVNLAWIKQNRISQRLLGPLGYTMVTRSFDGVQFVANSPKQNLTVMGFLPTRGNFDLNGMDSLPAIRVGYMSLTLPRARKESASDARLFYLYYEDTRTQAVKTDNRPLVIRTADSRAIRISTFGAHYTRVMKLGAGKADVLAWAAGQLGKWGPLDHGAYAAVGELGYQMPRWDWKPWFRVGYDYYSGDGNPANNQHGTFFPVMPTHRLYSRYALFTESNLQDVFGQVILRPNARLSLRADLHSFRLAQNRDLWYAGPGAGENQVFGYSGRPSSGRGDLATLVDLSADYQLTKSTAFTLYAAYANGGRPATIFNSRDSIFGYAELNWKF